jgi:bacterioferritin-associated ferredoxin
LIVCLCHGVRDRDIDEAIDRGAATVDDLGDMCGAGTGCGACVDDLEDKLAASVTCAGRGGSHAHAGEGGVGACARAPISLRGRGKPDKAA